MSADFLCAVSGRVDARDTEPDVLDDRLACGGQLRAASGPAEQLDAEVALHPRQRLAQGGLSDAEQVGRLGHAAGVGDRKEIFEVPGVHRASISKCYEFLSFP